MRAQGGGTVESGKAFVPEVYFGGKYYPICGHYFWNDDFGAASVCATLGFKSGSRADPSQSETNIGPTYDVDAMPVGACKDGEEVMNCTGGGNAWGEFDYESGMCKQGEEVGVKVICNSNGSCVCMCVRV